MKIYGYGVPSNLDLPKEWVYVDEDATAWYYKNNGKVTDRSIVYYMCEVPLQGDGSKYERVKYRRLYEMYYKEVDSLEELESWLKECYEKQIWFEVGYRDGIMQFDPWSD